LSSDVDSSINQDNLDIDSVITNVKQEFKNFLIKREQLVIKLGKALENEHQNKKENICAEIKGILRQEVADGLISRRDIERYSLDEWKKNTKPKKEENDNLSFSTQEQQAAPRILVDAHGNSEIESVAISTADPNNNVIIYDDQPQDVENLNADATPVDEDLEQAIKKSTSFTTADQQLSEQATVAELKTENEILKSNLQSKSDENSALHIRIKELEARPQNDQEDRSFDVQFQYLFDPLQQHMASLFKKHIRYVSFITKVDPITKRILNVQIYEENSESEQTV
jgi:hypothetical protein